MKAKISGRSHTMRIQNEVRRGITPQSKRVAFTGYRPQKMPFGFDETDERCADFKKRLRDTIENLIWQGYRHFISGGAMGMDMFAAEIVLDLKKQYPEITLEMVSPFDDQAAKWKPEYQKRRARLFQLADMTTAIAHEYSKSCLFERNRYLVNNAARRI